MFLDPTSLSCSGNDEWLDYPPVCNGGNHERGVIVMFALERYNFKKSWQYVHLMSCRENMSYVCEDGGTCMGKPLTKIMSGIIYVGIGILCVGGGSSALNRV